MARLAAKLAVAGVLVAMVAAPASGRTLKAYSDPRDTIQQFLDIRRVSTDESETSIYVRVKFWEKRWGQGVQVYFDTRGTRRQEYVLEMGRGSCVVVKLTRDGYPDQVVGKRDLMRRDWRTMACEWPKGWFRTGKPVSLDVVGALAPRQRSDRAPDIGRYHGL